MEETTEQRQQREQAERDQAAQFLETRWLSTARACPICGTSGWETSPVYEARPFTGAEQQIGVAGSMLPFFTVTCHACGYFHTFSAVAAGLT